MKMSTATDIKYVYVNYIVSPHSALDINSMLEANKTDMLATDASFGQFIEILNPEAIEAANQQTTMILQPDDQFDSTSDMTILASGYLPENVDEMEFMTPSDRTVISVPVEIPSSQDHMDVLGQEIVSIAEVDRVEDHLQRLTKELLFDEPELDTSCGSFVEFSEEDEAEDDDSEHDLTNLAWLSDPNRSIAVNVLAAVAEEGNEQPVQEPVEKKEKPPKSVKTTTEADEEVKDPAQILIRDKNLTQERFNKFMVQVQECQQSYTLSEVDYRENSIEKPPFIYAQMIAMAMVEQGRMTLKDIEQWIQDRFAYYRCNGNWNNSIRHNLSIHFGFTKIARDKNEKGKGGYWELSMNITKGEKKRVRNRSKRGLANGARGGTGGAKRPRREGKAKLRKEEVQVSVPLNVEESKTEQDEVQIATEMLMKVLPQNIESGTQMSDGYETACSDANTSNGYEHDVYASTLLHEGANEIFLGCDIPLSGDCIIIPYTGHSLTAPSSCTSSNSPNSTTILESTPTSPSIDSTLNYDPSICLDGQLTAHATLIAHGLTNPSFGPNVIVETLPYGGALSHQQDMLDQVVDIERQFSSMVTMPEPELMAEYDAYFDYSW